MWQTPDKNAGIAIHDRAHYDRLAQLPRKRGICMNTKDYTLFQKQISETFPGLGLIFEDSKFHLKLSYSQDFKINSPYGL